MCVVFVQTVSTRVIPRVANSRGAEHRTHESAFRCRYLHMRHSPLHRVLALVVIGLASGGGERCLAETPRKDAAVSHAAPAVTNHLDESTARLAKKIGAARAQGHALSVLREMHQLMKKWSPVGLSQERVIELLWKPSSIKGEVIIYRFDHGEGGWQWEFEVKKGVVSKVNKVGLE